MNLYQDATGVIVGTQAEAKRMGKGWEQINVPTDKQGLIDYLNQRPYPTVEDTASALMNTPVVEAMVTREPGAIVHASQADIDAMFDPKRSAGSKPLRRDQVCEAISTYDGVDLGYVALEVACRFTALAKS